MIRLRDPNGENFAKRSHPGGNENFRFHENACVKFGSDARASSVSKTSYGFVKHLVTVTAAEWDKHTKQLCVWWWSSFLRPGYAADLCRKLRVQGEFVESKKQSFWSFMQTASITFARMWGAIQVKHFTDNFNITVHWYRFDKMAHLVLKIVQGGESCFEAIDVTSGYWVPASARYTTSDLQ